MRSPFTDYTSNDAYQTESVTDRFQPEAEEFMTASYEQPESFEGPYSLENDQFTTDNETFYEYDLPTPSQDITDALNKKDWQQALKLAVKDCSYTTAQLTNLLFFARHPELPKESLKRGQANFDKLSREWNTILAKEILPFIANEDLQVSVKYVFERDKEFLGNAGKKFKKLVEDIATDAGLNPGFVAAVLLAETSRNSYLTSGGVSSFETGTDNFFASQSQIRANVPAFTRVHFVRNGTNTNEHGNVVISVLFGSGRDAALGTAVYLKNAEIKLRNGAKKNGGDFDKFPVETRFALTRIAMAAGHGGIQPDGEFLWFKKKNGKTVPAKKGEAGSFLVGVAPELNRAINGEDIFIRVNEERKNPTNSRHVTLRNATILTAQALHLSECIFGISIALSAQPQTDKYEYFNDGNAELSGTDHESKQFQQVSLRKANIFMAVTGEKQGVIKGSVIQKGREGSIAVYQFQHELLSPGDATTGAATGKRKAQTLVITKEVDGASVKLINSLATNERLKEVIVNFWRLTANGSEENFYRIVLTNASIAGISQETPKETAQNGQVFLEKLQITYQKIEWTYLPGGLSAIDDRIMTEAESFETIEETDWEAENPS